MPHPRRLPSTRSVPWAELRKNATIVYLWLQAGWSALTDSERAELRELITKSKGRPRNLTRQETRRLGSLAGRAASAAARSHRRRA